MVGFWAFFTGEELSDMQKERIATLGKETVEARTKLAEAEKDLLELQGSLRKEQQARLNLEMVVTPREIDDSKFIEFSKTLRPFAGTLVEVGAIDEREPKQLAASIVELLKYSGWKVTEIDPLQIDVGEGVRIHVAEPTERPPVLQAVSGVMTASKIVTRITFAWPDQHANTVRIIVGPQDTLQLRWRDKKQP